MGSQRILLVVNWVQLNAISGHESSVSHRVGVSPLRGLQLLELLVFYRFLLIAQVALGLLSERRLGDFFRDRIVLRFVCFGLWFEDPCSSFPLHDFVKFGLLDSLFLELFFLLLAHEASNRQIRSIFVIPNFDGALVILRNRHSHGDILAPWILILWRKRAILL